VCCSTCLIEPNVLCVTTSNIEQSLETERMADMSPMAVDLDTNHNDNNHSPAGLACSVGSGGSTGIPMLVVHKRKMMQIQEDNHHQQEQNNHHGQHGQHGGMEADADCQPIDDHQDTDSDCLSHQKWPLNNNDVATAFLIDTSEVGPGHDDADQAVEVN
jgi:hypothetical protein